MTETTAKRETKTEAEEKAGTEVEAKEKARLMQKEAEPEMKAKRYQDQSMQKKEAELRVQPCAWGLICPGAV